MDKVHMYEKQRLRLYQFPVDYNGMEHMDQ